MRFWSPGIHEFRYMKKIIDNIIGVLYVKDVMIELRKISDS